MKPIKIKFIEYPENDPYRDIIFDGLGIIRSISFPEVSFNSKKIERDFNEEDIEKTTQFEINRDKFLPLLRAIIRQVFEQFKLPKNNIIEFGSGATGYFYSKLKPPEITNWLQIEINKNAIKENLRRNPGIKIQQGSYYDIKHKEIDMICGLSSFDTAIFMEKALNQVANSLKKGGYFLHIQDVRPGLNTVNAYIKKNTKESATTTFELSEPDSIIGLNIGNKIVPTTTLFREYIVEEIKKNLNLELVFDGFAHAELELPAKTSEEESNSYYYFNSIFENIRNPKNTKAATVLITIAKKN